MKKPADLAKGGRVKRLGRVANGQGHKRESRLTNHHVVLRHGRRLVEADVAVIEDHRAVGHLSAQRDCGAFSSGLLQCGIACQRRVIGDAERQRLSTVLRRDLRFEVVLEERVRCELHFAARRGAFQHLRDLRPDRHLLGRPGARATGVQGRAGCVLTSQFERAACLVRHTEETIIDFLPTGVKQDDVAISKAVGGGRGNGRVCVADRRNGLSRFERGAK